MTIHFVVPGLLDPWPEPDQESESGQSLGRFPVLEKMLARGKRISAPADYPRTLFSLLGMPVASQENVPTASLCWLADFGRPPPANLLHADPVYLKPDMDNVQLFRSDNLTRRQAEAYVQAFNQFYQEYGYHLQSTTADRWYLTAPEPFHTPGSSLDQVTGRNLRSFVTTGNQSKEWNQLFTEIQMLFYDLPINQDRRVAGDYPVSGLWLSGSGDLPVVGEHEVASMDGDDPLLLGLALHAGVPVGELSEATEGDFLLLMPDSHKAWLMMDFSAWQESLERVDRVLGKWLNQGQEVTLYPCNGQAWQWNSGSRFKVWRRKRPLSTIQCTHRHG